MICGCTVERSPPAVLRLMKARHAKVDGKRQEKHFQKSGNDEVGHENPVRNMATGDITSKRMNTVSRRRMKELHVMLKKTQSVMNNISRMKMSSELPRCGKANIAGTMKAMYDAMPT